MVAGSKEINCDPKRKWNSREPYGYQLPNQDKDGDSVPFYLNLRMPGQWFDSETGLYHNGFRDYDPQVGRYIQPDPIGLAGGWNEYAYVGSDPVEGVDPYGLKSYIWLEGANKNEPFSHLSIAFGDPAGQSAAFSFGLTGGVADGYKTLSLNPPMGYVYRDQERGGTIKEILELPDDKSVSEIFSYFQHMLNYRAYYSPFHPVGMTCISFSRFQFEYLAKRYGSRETTVKFEEIR